MVGMEVGMIVGIGFGERGVSWCLGFRFKVWVECLWREGFVFL